MNKDDDIRIKEKFRQAYSRVDGKITPSGFDQDWSAASSRVEQGPEKNSAGNFFGLFNSKSLPRSAYGISLAAVILLILSVLLISRRPAEVPVDERTDDQAVTKVLNPNNAWYMPTDDLLQIDVLKYEYQWVTFASYDPITMEIR